MAKSVVLAGRIKEGGYGSTILGSVVAHLLFLGAVIVLPMLFPGIPLTPGSGGGGGGGGDNSIIPVTLTGVDLGGGTGAYKPILTSQPPAVELPKPEPEKVKPDAIAIPDPLTKPKKEKEKKPKDEPSTKLAAKLSPAEQKVTKNAAKVPEHYVPTKTGPGAGGIPGLAAGPQGVRAALGAGPARRRRRLGASPSPRPPHHPPPH